VELDLGGYSSAWIEAGHDAIVGRVGGRCVRRSPCADWRAVTG
jgi:hypothetical protein